MVVKINYCVRCGATMTDKLAFGEIRRVCPNCEYVHFIDPKVAAVAFVHDDKNRVLLVKRAMEPERGKWALPAGYVNGTESPSAAAIRETLEETGIHIEIVQLLDVLHNLPSTDGHTKGASIIIVYEARPIGGTLCAQDDVDDAQWFTPDALPDIAFESTRQALRRWQHEQT